MPSQASGSPQAATSSLSAFGIADRQDGSSDSCPAVGDVEVVGPSIFLAASRKATDNPWT
jgi:hypothetical protein